MLKVQQLETQNHQLLESKETSGALTTRHYNPKDYHSEKIETLKSNLMQSRKENQSLKLMKLSEDAKKRSLESKLIDNENQANLYKNKLADLQYIHDELLLITAEFREAKEKSKQEEEQEVIVELEQEENSGEYNSSLVTIDKDDMFAPITKFDTAEVDEVPKSMTKTIHISKSKPDECKQQ